MQNEEKKKRKSSITSFKTIIQDSSPVHSDANLPSLLEYLYKEASRIKQEHDDNEVTFDSQAADRNAAIQHMYDTRRDFIEDANRYYTHYLVALAAALYSFKYSLDAEDSSSQRLLFVGTAILFLLIAGFVYTCKRLLQSVYYLYSASVVTAAIKSLATKDWNHAWFDSVKIVAAKKERIERSFYHPWGFGVTPPRRNETCPRECIANEWSAENRSLLGINSIAHDVLFLVLILSVIVSGCMAACPPKRKANSMSTPQIGGTNKSDIQELISNFDAKIAALQVSLDNLKVVDGGIDRDLKEIKSFILPPKDKFPADSKN
jgi:hypothetical protein